MERMQPGYLKAEDIVDLRYSQKYIYLIVSQNNRT